MTQLHFLGDWAIWTTGVAFWTSCFFTPVVSTFWAWWKDEWGWNIVTLESVIALALLRPILITEFGVAKLAVWLVWTGDIAVTLVPVIIVWRTVLIFVDQVKGSRRRDQTGAATKELTQD